MGLSEHLTDDNKRQEAATQKFKATEDDIEQATEIAQKIGISDEDALYAIKQAKKMEAYNDIMDEYEAPPEADIEFKSGVIESQDEDVSEKIDTIMDENEWYDKGSAEINIRANTGGAVDELDDIDSLTRPSDWNSQFPESVPIEELTRVQDALSQEEHREALKNGDAVDLGNGLAIQARKSRHTDRDILVVHFTDEDEQSVEASDDPSDFGIEEETSASQGDLYIRERNAEDPDFGDAKVVDAA